MFTAKIRSYIDNLFEETIADRLFIAFALVPIVSVKGIIFQAIYTANVYKRSYFLYNFKNISFYFNRKYIHQVLDNSDIWNPFESHQYLVSSVNPSTVYHQFVHMDARKDLYVKVNFWLITILPQQLLHAFREGKKLNPEDVITIYSDGCDETYIRHRKILWVIRVLSLIQRHLFSEAGL